MKLTLWGTRGSIAAAGPDTIRYGGDTSCVHVVSSDGSQLILDAGSGIRSLGRTMVGTDRVDILLTHLHMDHVQGLPFFAPLLDSESEVHIWGPVSTSAGLRQRLSRYLSPPLFPIHVRDLPSVQFHDVHPGTFEVGGMEVTSDLVSHPGSTLGYRLTDGGSVVTYISDHEPALGILDVSDPQWVSGFALSHGADVLIHDSQYTDEEYEERVGWGHTSTTQLETFTRMAEARRLVTFHHDPAHDDSLLDGQLDELGESLPEVEVVGGTVGLELEV